MLDVMALVAFPILAGIAGAVLAALQPPAPRFASAVQHFAAGVVFAAVAGEILPTMTAGSHAPTMVSGFMTGVALMLAIGAWQKRTEESSDGADVVPVGALLGTGVDLLIDGVLIGVAVVAGATEGLLLTFALTLEILFLGLSTATLLRRGGTSPAQTILIVAGLSLLTGVGALATTAVGSALSGGILVFVLSFGCAALLYLVTEELLVEAHASVPDSSWRAAMFFVGFLLVLLLGVGNSA